MKRPAIMAGGNFFIRRASLLQRQFARQRCKRIQLRTKLIRTVEITFRQFDGRQLSRADALAQFAHR